MKTKYYDEQVFAKYTLDRVADFAAILLERFALIAGARGDEDSAGRASMDLLPCHDTVDRAFTISRLFWERVEAENMVADLGPLEERLFLRESYDSMRLVPVKTTSIKDDIMAERK